MKNRIEKIRMIHARLKGEKKEVEKDLVIDPDNVGEEYFDKAENALGRAENPCDDDRESWEIASPLEKHFDKVKG